MKRILLTLVAVIALAVSASAQADLRPTVSVNGQAKITAPLDEIFLSITLKESDSKGKIDLEQQRTSMLRALRKCGINCDEQLRLADMASSFFKRKGSLASSQYELKVGSAEEARKVFEALDDAGIANVNIARATCSKIEEYRSEARREAIRNAKARAEELATAIGQSIGACYEINDYSNSQPVVYRANMLTKSAMADGLVEESAEPEVEFKPIEINYSVSAKFILNE
ncbi:MAG: SIMPL domain-containing protein [Alistipes sp.]|nr:SIMPL domain-containing protein [Alistipes sp.]